VKRKSILAFMLFLYDCARAGFVFAMVKEQINIPFVAVNALFPVMGFFLFVNPQKYREYVPLYAAGKAIGVVAGFAWLLFTARTGAQFSQAVRFNNTFIFFMALSGLTDTLSLAVRVLMHKSKKEPEPFQSVGDIVNCE
jgi:sugar phosphate permease